MATKRPNKVPFQPLRTELETVAVATGTPDHLITFDLLRGLMAGMKHTSCPLKDAVHHLLSMRENTERYRILMRDLQDMISDEAFQLKTKSVRVPIDVDEKRWQETIEELQEVLFRLI